MVKHFRKHGAASHEIEVKVFGGADMFGAGPGGMGGISVGKQNAEKALDVIKKEGLLVTAHDLGGTQGRKIFFNTKTGEVLLKRLQPNVVLAGEGVSE
jgi:chemotaxis protein CheD